MNLNELKQEAELAANEIQLNWDQLDDPREATKFTTILQQGTRMIPDLEHLYTKLSSGKSVVTPNKESTLSYEELERYRQLVEDELHAAYLIQAVYDKFEKVNSIIQLSQENQL
jgi:homoserine dehydrogenase